jgi:hypothetical protein
VALVIDFNDLDAFMEMLASDAGASAKAEDGVIDAGLMMFTEVK